MNVTDIIPRHLFCFGGILYIMYQPNNIYTVTQSGKPLLYYNMDEIRNQHGGVIDMYEDPKYPGMVRSIHSNGYITQLSGLSFF